MADSSGSGAGAERGSRGFSAVARAWLADQRGQIKRSTWGSYALFELAVATGARRSELLALVWADVDHDAMAVRFRRMLTVVDGEARFDGLPAARARTVHIPERTAVALTRQRRHVGDLKAIAVGRWMREEDVVFTGPEGAHLHPNTVTDEFQRLLRAAPVPPIRFQDLRALHAAMLIRGGVSLRVAARRLGYRRIDELLQLHRELRSVLDRDAAARFEAARDTRTSSNAPPRSSAPPR